MVKQYKERKVYTNKVLDVSVLISKLKKIIPRVYFYILSIWIILLLEVKCFDYCPLMFLLFHITSNKCTPLTKLRLVKLLIMCLMNHRDIYSKLQAATISTEKTLAYHACLIMHRFKEDSSSVYERCSGLACLLMVAFLVCVQASV